jgi:hypothetical protein
MANPLPVPLEMRVNARAYFFFLAVFLAAFFFVAMLLPPLERSPLKFYFGPNFVEPPYNLA